MASSSEQTFQAEDRGEVLIFTATTATNHHREGDTILDTCVLDYLLKRGFHQTAGALMREGNLSHPDQTNPPVDLPQSLILEWWNAFWLIYHAKRHGDSGADDAGRYVREREAREELRPSMDDARTYTQHLRKQEALKHTLTKRNQGAIEQCPLD